MNRQTITLVFVAFLCAWCCAKNVETNSFIVQEKPAARKNRQQIKQEASELMGQLIEQSSLSLERDAQIQQLLCKEVRAAYEGAQESKLNKGSTKDLELLLPELQKELKRRSEHLAAQNAFLATLKK